MAAPDRPGLDLSVASSELPEAEVLRLLAAQIQHLLLTQRDWLLGKLYRLDVREADIRAALRNPVPELPARALARLVLARHRERVRTKARFSSPPLDDEDLRW